MDKTKIYIVSLGSFGFSYPHKAFLDKEEAEFYAWSQNQKHEDSMVWRSSFYVVSDIEILKVEKSSKEYEKFKKEKIADIEKDIQKKKDCKSSDEKSIEELEAQKIRLTS